MMKSKSSKFQAFILSAFTLCLVATTAVQDASARHHKNSDKNQSAADGQVGMEIFPIQRGYDGAQFIVTKAGYTVSIPGLGVAPNATEIAAYKDEQNNIWYIDRNGVPVKLTNEQVQWGAAQINQQAQARAMAAGQPPATQYAQAPASSTVVVEQQPTQSSSGGVGALATGLAAAGGAMAGAALSTSLYHNNYGGIPYGVPVYHRGGKYYYNGSNGNKVYINNSLNHTSVNQINQWNHQTNWQNNQYNKRATQYPARSSGGHAHAPTQLPAHNGVNSRQNNAGRHHGGAGGHAAHVSRGAARGGRRR